MSDEARRFFFLSVFILYGMSGFGIGVGMNESPLDKISWSDFVYSMSVGWEMDKSFMGKKGFLVIPLARYKSDGF